MQVAIVYCAKDQNSQKLASICKAISEGLERNGHHTLIVNARTDSDKRLTIYDYLIVVSEPLSILSSKIPSDDIVKYLSNAGQVSGKRAACVITSGLRSEKALLRLMGRVESQGIIIKTSEIVKNEGIARAFGSHLNVEPNFR